MILKYSDLKGRTDLVGRKVLLENWDDIFTITAVDEDAFSVTAPLLPNVKQYFTSQRIKLLDEEPEHKLHFVEYHGIDNESGKRTKVSPDTRTEITWENATMEDTLSREGMSISYTVRGFLIARAREEGLSLRQTQPIKMTLSQIEEKLGHKVEIVD